MGILGIVLDYFGAIIRWLYGTIWRTIANKPKFKFSEYINGPENSDDWFDFAGHSIINRVIGMITLLFIIYIVNTLEI